MKWKRYTTPPIVTNRFGQPKHTPLGRIQRELRSAQLSLRSAYNIDAAQNWGSRQTVPAGGNRRLIDVVLPEPQDLTVYCRGTPEGGVLNDHESWQFDWSSGGTEERLTVTGPAIGFVKQFVAQTLRVTAFLEAGGAFPESDMQAIANLGRPSVQRLVNGIGSFTNAAPVTIAAPPFTTAVYVNSSDPDWLGGPAVVDWLDSTGSPVPFAAYNITHFSDRFTPIEVAGISLRFTAALATTVSDAAVVWEGMY